MSAVANVVTIAGKELRIYGTTAIAYVLVAGFLELTAFFFYLLMRDFQLRRLELAQQRAAAILDYVNLTDLVIGPMLSYVAMFFVFLLPVLTMRLFAAERSGKTLELLLSMPIGPAQIVLGKFLGAWLIMATMLALTLIFPISLQLFAGDADPNAVDWSTVAAGYLGMLLLGSAAVGVGLFASAITESQIVAVVIAFGVLLGLMVIGVAGRGQPEMIKAVLEYVSLGNHLNPFVRGIVRSVDVVYYLSLTFVGLYLSYRVVEAQRWR